MVKIANEDFPMIQIRKDLKRDLDMLKIQLKEIKSKEQSYSDVIYYLLEAHDKPKRIVVEVEKQREFLERVFPK